MKAIIKNSLLLTAVLGILIAPSCTQRQVGKGAAVVAVGTAIGAAVILDDANRRDGRYHPRPYPRPRPVCKQVRECHRYFDRWGNARKDCRYVTRCNNRRHYFMALNEGGFDAINAALTEQSVTDVVDVVDFAKAHDLSFEGAEKFASALDAAKEGNFDELNELGLEKKDIESIALLKMPSDEAFAALSENLDQYEVMTRGMIGRMLTKARKYKEALEESND